MKSCKKFAPKGGGSLKNDVIIKGGSKIMTHDDKGGGGVNKTQNGGDVICAWSLMYKFILLGLF